MNNSLERECPHCHSTDIRKAGVMRNGTRKYLCKTCKKYFSKNTVVREEVRKKCPVCGSAQIVRCGIDRGQQRYQCKECKKRFSDLTPEVILSHKITCPRCGTVGVVRKGIDRGRQFYLCKTCNHSFSPEQKYKHLTKEEQADIIRLWKEGHQITELMKAYSKQRRTIRDLIRPYKERYELQHLKNAVNRLSPQEKKIIYMYGVGARVPVEDVAKHLKIEAPLVRFIILSYLKKMEGVK